MAIATLSVDLVAKLGNIESDLGRIGQIAQRQADQMERAFSGVRATLAGIGAGISLGGVVTAFKAATDALDRLNDAADATSASIASLSKLEEVARRNGAGIETVENAVLRMNKALAGADEEGKGAAAVLKAIGVNVAELKAMDPAEALQKVAIAFNGFARDGELARAAQMLFGKSIAEVAPFLKDLAEAGELSATSTAAQTEEAERFNKALFGLKTDLGNVARTVAADLLPKMNLLVSAYSSAESESEGLSAASNIVLTVFEAVSVMGVNVAYVFKQMGNEIGGMAAQAAALLTFDFSGFSAIGEMMKSDAAAARKEVDALTASLLNRNKAAEGLIGPPEDLKNKPRLSLPAGKGLRAGKGPRAGGAARPAKENLDYIDNARRIAQELEKELAALAKREQELAAPIGAILDRLREQSLGMREAAETAGMSAGEIAGLTASQIEEAAALAELNGAYDSQIESLLAVARGYRDVAESAEKKRLAEALQETVTGKLEAQRREMEFFADALDRGAISAEQFAEIATAKLGLVADQAKETKGIAEELGLTFSSAFEDAIVSGAKLSDLLKSLGKDLARIGTRKAITEPLGNTISGLLGGSATSSGASGGLLNSLSNLYSAGSKLYDLGAKFFGAGAAGAAGGALGGTGLTVSASTLAAFGIGGGATTAGIAGGVGGGTGLTLGTSAGGAAFAGEALGSGLSAGAATGSGAAAGAAAGEGAASAAAGLSSTGWGVVIAAVVLAVMAALPKGGGPKFEGSFDNKNLERFFTKSDADAQSRDVVASIAIGYDQLAKTLGGKADQNIRLAFGFAVDPVGDAPNALHLAVGKQDFIQDQGRPDDLQAQVTETIQRGLLSALKQTDLYDSIDELLSTFDPMKATGAEVAAEMTKITDAMNALTEKAQTYAVSLGQIGDSMASTHNMFIDSVRNIRYGNADTEGKYRILDEEAARYRDMLKVLIDPELIGDYAKRLNETINSAFALLSPDQQAAQADSFISRLNAADQLAQTRYQQAADAQKAVYASLPGDLRKAVEDGFATLPARIAAAIPKGLQVDFRANVPGTTEVAMIG